MEGRQQYQLLIKFMTRLCQIDQHSAKINMDTIEIFKKRAGIIREHLGIQKLSAK